MKFPPIRCLMLVALATGAMAQPAAQAPAPPVAVKPAQDAVPGQPAKADPASIEPKPAEAPAPAKAEAPAPAKPEAPDWEKSISRVTVLNGNLAVAVPVGDAAVAKAKLATGKVPHVFSPYPPKALMPLPGGWSLGMDAAVPATLQRATLADGRVLEIAVTAPVLQAADPQAVPLVLPTKSGSMVQALGDARKSQAASAAAVRALIEALATRLPAPPAEATPPAR